MRTVYLILLALLLLGGVWLNSGTRVTPPTAAPPPISSFTLYRHFTNSFSLQVPPGWHINPHDDGLVASEPGGASLLEVQVVNTGVSLSEASFTRYMEAIEANTFANFVNYRVVEQTPSDNCVLWRKTLESKNVLFEVRSRYCHQAEVTWQITLWMPVSRLAEYETLWQRVITSWQIDIPTIKTFTPYRDHYVATEANRRADYWVPYGWRRVGETFTAPDDLNLVRLDILAASTDPLAFLQSLYTGATVSTERVENEVRYLTWASPEVHGQAALAVKREQLFVYTWSVKNVTANTFTPTGKRLMELFSLR